MAFISGASAAAAVPKLPPPRLSPDNSHTVLIRDDGVAVAFGSNRFGQCDVPTLAAGSWYIAAVAGSHHTILVQNDGSASGIGLNTEGQCDVPVIPEGKRYIGAAAAYVHTVLVRDDGLAVAFGDNRHGQCDVPTLPVGTRYVGAAAGQFHTVLIRDDGIAVAFGSNHYGQCNVPALPAGKHYMDAAAGRLYTVLVRDDGIAVSTGRVLASHCHHTLPADQWYVGAAAREWHIVLVRNDGLAVDMKESFAIDMGDYDKPELPQDKRAIGAVAGCHHGILITDDGEAFAFGCNNSGQCNVPALPIGTRYCSPKLVECTHWSPLLHNWSPPASRGIVLVVLLAQAYRARHGPPGFPPQSIIIKCILPFAVPAILMPAVLLQLSAPRIAPRIPDFGDSAVGSRVPSEGFNHSSETTQVAPHSRARDAETSDEDKREKGENSEQELEQALQLSEQEALEREGADISEALLLSKAEDPVVIFRLTKTSEEVTNMFLTAPELSPLRRRVEEAGCMVMPDYLKGAKTFVPLTAGQYIESGLELQKHHVVALWTDRELIEQVLRLRVKCKKRPQLRDEHRALKFESMPEPTEMSMASSSTHGIGAALVGSGAAATEPCERTLEETFEDTPIRLLTEGVVYRVHGGLVFVPEEKEVSEVSSMTWSAPSAPGDSHVCSRLKNPRRWKK